MHFLIIGGGFVGTALACELLKQAPAGSSITLANSGGPLGKGLAYGTQSPLHLLNVPAARMSWTDEQPDDFVNWLAGQGNTCDGAAFVPRQRYGDYLAVRLREHIAARPDVHWQQLQDRIDSLAPEAGRWIAQCAHGPALTADRVLLALGNFAPACPHPSLQALPADRYVGDPWQPEALSGLPADAPVALIGTGLTMLDLLISLQALGHHGPVLAISRRGLLPKPHRENELPPPQWQAPTGWLAAGSLRSQLREVRQAIGRAQANGQDWRDVWVALRPRTTALWHRLDERARAQFLRHLLPFWDVHRHRAAPQALAVLRAAQAQGRVQAAAGRLLGARVDADGLVALQWRARGGQDTQEFKAARVFNCTGPSTRLAEGRRGLFGHLLHDGRLRPCPLGLGLEVGAGYALADAEGREQPGLFYVGPMLRSQHWEATAVPELRAHAKAAARAALGC